MKRPAFLTYEDVLAAALPGRQRRRVRRGPSAAGRTGRFGGGLWQAYTSGLSGRQQHLLWESVVRQRGLQLALLCLAAAAPPARLLFACLPWQWALAERCFFPF